MNIKSIARDLFCAANIYIMSVFPASAENMNSEIIRKDDIVYYSQNITPEAFLKLKRMYQEKPFKAISITSNGGDYEAGMRMAHLVSENDIVVYVPLYCASACTFVFFGARVENRDISPKAQLGLHNVSLSVTDDELDQKVTVREAILFAQKAVTRSGMMMAFYAANGIPSDVLLEVSQAYGSSIVNIQRADLLKWGSILE